MGDHYTPDSCDHYTTPGSCDHYITPDSCDHYTPDSCDHYTPDSCDTCLRTFFAAFHPPPRLTHKAGAANRLPSCTPRATATESWSPSSRRC